MSGRGAIRVAAYFARSYRRTWRGSALTTFVNPVLYLLAMGVGLGHFVDHAGASPSLGRVSYLDFVAPALAAAAAVQVAASEATYPIMGAVKWQRTYFSMLATPLGVGEVLAGHLLWIGARVSSSVVAYLAVMATFGATPSPEAAAVLPAAVLTGAAFATPLAAFSVTQENDGAFSLVFRLGIVPLFLFSGVFFPLGQLPVGLRIAAYATPLWHGVDLCRSLSLGRATPAACALNVSYLLAVTLVGVLAGRVTYRRRLRV